MNHSTQKTIFEQEDPADPGQFYTTVNRHARGHARLTIKGRNHAVHRLMYELRRGPIPEGKILLRRCPHLHCINPSHYRLLTHAQQGRLMQQEGRYPCGSRMACAKLSEADVKRIRRLHAAGKRSCRQLTEEYEVDHSNIIRIVLRERWKHVE